MPVSGQLTFSSRRASFPPFPSLVVHKLRTNMKISYTLLNSVLAYATSGTAMEGYGGGDTEAVGGTAEDGATAAVGIRVADVATVAAGTVDPVVAAGRRTPEGPLCLAFCRLGSV